MTKNIRGVVDLYEEVYDELIEYLCTEGLITKEPWSAFASKLKDCLDLLNDNNISGMDPQPLKLMNLVDKFSLGSQVKALYSQGKGPEDISEYFITDMGIDIPASQIETWLVDYKSAPVVRPNEGRWGNVFDVGTQLQTLFEELSTFIQDVKDRDNNDFKGKSDKSEILLAHTSEKRQLLKDAKELLTTIKMIEDNVNMKNVLLEELRKESPACAQRVMIRWRDVRQSFTILS